MRSLSNLVALVVALTAGVLSGAHAQVPELCEVPIWDALDGIVLCPPLHNGDALPATVVTVYVADGDGPMHGVQVSLAMNGQNPECGNADFSAITVDGWAEIRAFGGGCQSGGNVAVLWADQVPIRAYRNIKSPDFDGSGGNLVVNISDLASFSTEFLSPPGGESCHDYDNNLNVGLSDLIIFGPAFTGAAECN